MLQEGLVSENMRITILGLNYAPEPTGIAPYTVGLAEGLRARGHRVTVLTGIPHYPQWKVADGYRAWGRNENVNGVRVKRLWHYVPRTPTHLRRMLMELTFGMRLATASWERPDVVVCVSPALFASVIALCRARFARSKYATVLWVQDLYSKGIVETSSARKPVAHLMHLCEALAARWATGVIVIHESFKSYIEVALRIPADQVEAIRNWTHLPLAPAIDRERMRASLGWRPDDVVLLHAGNLGVKQGLQNVVRAASLAAERRSNVRFVLLGDGSQRDHLRRAGEGVLNLQFMDPLPDNEFQAVLLAADILLLNELAGVEGMSVPSKLTSYFNTGRPVLAATGTNSASANEIAAAGAGVRVNPDSPGALLAAAEDLAADPGMATRLGAAGLEYRTRELSRDTAITHFERYLSTLKITRGRPAVVATHAR